jgi:dephospho-CoA kinase
MLIIGLTGGIGCGKSTVARHFEALGVPVIDADDITRQQVEPGQPALVEIVRHFGPDMLRPDGRLNRARLRERVFADPAQRRTLEAILHPRARIEIQRRLAILDAPYAMLSAPLLIESGWTELVDRILVIDCPRGQQIQRTRQRDGLSVAQIEAIIDSQAGRDTRLAAADDVILNDGDSAELPSQVKALHQRYTQSA